MRRYLTLLGNRNFVGLWGGQSISNLGDSIFHIAILWLVVELTGSALGVGLFLILYQIPYLVFQIIGGVCADRFDRRRILLLTDMVQGLVTLIFAWLVLTGKIQLWQVYCLAVVFGAAAAFFSPAFSALLPALVPKEDLVSANALNSATRQLNSIVGPALGGFLVALPQVGSGWVALFNAISFFIGAVGVWLIRLPQVERKFVKSGFFTELLDGLQYLKAHRVILVLIVLASLANFVTAPTGMLLPIFAKEILGVGVQGFGLMEAGFGLGALGGALLIGAFGRLRRRGLYLMGMLAINGFLLAAFAFSQWLVMAVGLLTAFGLANTMLNVVITALLQELIAPEFRGRVFGFLVLIAAGLQPLAVGLGGSLADLFGVVHVIAAGGLLAIAVALAGFLLRDIRRLE